MQAKTDPWLYNPSYDQIERAIGALNGGILVRGLDRKILYANDRMLDWLGYTAEELAGMEASLLVPREIRSAVEREMRDIEAGSERARITVFQRKDGRTFPVVTAAHVIRDDPELEVVVSVIMDLGEVETARRVGTVSGTGVAASLERIAGELRTLSLFAGAPAAGRVPADHPDLELLTRREREILAELLAGARVPAIANKLFISPHTVRNHLKSMYRKLDVADQSALIEKVRGLAQLETEAG